MMDEEKNYEDLLDHFSGRNNHSEALEFAIKGDQLGVINCINKTEKNKRDQFINQRSPKNGRCILHEACVNGHANLIKYLLTLDSCDINLKSMLGNCTALHFAAIYGDRTIVFHLLSQGADHKAKDRYGNTPLHYASGQSSARLLNEYGASALALNRFGQNPCQAAKTRDEKDEVVQYLELIAAKEYKLQQSKYREQKLKHETDRVRGRLQKQKDQLYSKFS